MCMCACMNSWAPSVCRWPQRPAEDVRSPGTEVIGHSEPADEGARNSPRSSVRAVRVLNCWAPALLPFLTASISFFCLHLCSSFPASLIATKEKNVLPVLDLMAAKNNLSNIIHWPQEHTMLYSNNVEHIKMTQRDEKDNGRKDKRGKCSHSKFQDTTYLNREILQGKTLPATTLYEWPFWYLSSNHALLEASFEQDSCVNTVITPIFLQTKNTQYSCMSTCFCVYILVCSCLYTCLCVCIWVCWCMYIYVHMQKPGSFRYCSIL